MPSPKDYSKPCSICGKKIRGSKRIMKDFVEAFGPYVQLNQVWKCATCARKPNCAKTKTIR